MFLVAGAGRAESAPGEAALQERVSAYWDARVARTARVYDFYPGPELGGPKDIAMIGEFGNMRFLDYRIEGIDIDSDTAVVSLTVTTEVTGLRQVHTVKKPRELPAMERWNRICGTWFRKPKRRSLVRSEFRPSELGEVPAEGPDCGKLAAPESSSGSMREEK